MNQNQTAVEWLIIQIKNDHIDKALTGLEWMKIFEQAKAMEKEQIMMAVKDSWYMAKGSNFQEPQEEDYYKSKYSK